MQFASIHGGFGLTRVAFLLLAIAALSACAQREMTDLEQYVAQVKAQKKARIDPLPAIRTFKPYNYSADSYPDPFAPPQEEEVVTEGEAPKKKASNGIQPDFTRPREELERFPLDALRMVGTVEQDEAIYGIVRTPEGVVHRVRPGNFLGKNHGKIIAINEQEIVLDEIVPDGLDGYQKRDASLALRQ